MISQTGFSAPTEKTHDKDPCPKTLSDVLTCFIRHNDGVSNYALLSKQKENHITIESYSFDSQNWPIQADKDIPTRTWKHKLVLYIPDQISHSKVLLYVGGGYNRDKDGKNEAFNEPKEQLNYANIALNNKAVVVELQDVPNQFLFMDGSYKREDQILAFTYKKVMSDPLKNAFLAGHLPMAKSVIKAMDLVQKILEQDHKISDAHFILGGASKRGWAVWLAALEDTRVDAIIPIVIDVLNTQKSMVSICKRYNGCPYALKDYVEEKLDDKLETQGFHDLMKIEDPFSYLGTDYDPKYKERLAIPKLIINASGDDFFVPDSSKWYFKALPGDANYIRYLPNSLHYFKGNPISDSTRSLASINDAVDSYLGFVLNKAPLPKIEWKFQTGSIDLQSSIKPKSVKLWTAFNENAPDFRFINTHTTWHFLKKKILSYFFKDICDTCYVEKNIPLSCEAKGDCKVQVSLPLAKKPSWRASFLELHYEIANRDFVVSTEVSIEFTGEQHSSKDL